MKPPPDDRERFQQVRRITEAALELPPAKRSEYVGKECGEDSVLAEAVWNVLHFAEDEWLERSPFAAADTKAPMAAPGDLLEGRYRISRLLARGGFSEIYQAVDEKLSGRAVVVKTLTPVVGRENSQSALFRSELESLARLHHPGIVRLLDWGLVRGVPFLVVEYVGGRTLRDALRAGERPAVFPAILDAVAAAHAAGVQHGDLKPENIILYPGDGGENPVIVDFGLARVAGLLDRGPRGISGPYSPPESIAGTPDARSDVYSLGVLGRELAEANTPAAARDVWNRACSQAPEHRFTDAVEMRRHYVAAIGADRHSWRPSRRMLAGIGAAGALAPAVYWFGLRRSGGLANLPFLGYFLPGNLAFPDRLSKSIVEFDKKTLAPRQAIPLPTGLSFELQVATLLIRDRDGGFLVNARKIDPVVLAYTASGVVLAEQSVDARFLNQLVFDPADGFQDTVVGGAPFTQGALAVNPYHHRVARKCVDSAGDYVGACLDAGRNIYMSEYGSGEIRRFRPDGSFDRVFAQVEPQSVTGLAVNPEGEILIAQHQSNRIPVIDRQGKIVRRISAPELQGVSQITVDPRDGLIYATSERNGRLVILDRNGLVQREIDLGGSRLGVGCVVPGDRA
jgi:predicted Ser/Thr protein kinase